MSMPRSLLTLLLTAALALPAALTAQTSTTHRGSLLVGGSAGFSSMSSDSDAGRVSHLTLTPRLQAFVAPGLAAGAALGIDRWQQGEAMIREVGIGPILTWYVTPGSAPILPYLTGSATYGRRTAENTSGVETGSFLGYRAGAGAVYLLNPHVGLTGEVYFDAVRGRSEDAAQVTDRDTVGFALGLSIFLFGNR